MTDGKERILDGLRKAMQAEKEGQHFYLMAAAKTEDEQGRQVFQDLANDEVEHFHFLRGQYKAVSETGKTDPHLKLGAAKTYEGGHPIFSDAIKSRIGGGPLRDDGPVHRRPARALGGELLPGRGRPGG